MLTQMYHLLMRRAKIGEVFEIDEDDENDPKLESFLERFDLEQK